MYAVTNMPIYHFVLVFLEIIFGLSFSLQIFSDSHAPINTRFFLEIIVVETACIAGV